MRSMKKALAVAAIVAVGTMGTSLPAWADPPGPGDKQCVPGQNPQPGPGQKAGTCPGKR